MAGIKRVKIMNDKDKSFFIKLVLSIVIFVSFLLILVFVVNLIRNKSFIVSQPPDFSARPTISNSASLDFYQIHELKQSKIITSGNYITEGYVVKKYTCPPCPKGFYCKECMDNNIIISENNKLLAVYSLTDKDLIIFTDNPDKFELNKKYRFSIEITEYKSTNEPLNNIKLVEYEAISEGENRTLEYLKNCEWQYEESQKENISTALNDILNLSEEELRDKRYSDYSGKENQWSLSKLIYSHCVWEPGKFLGGNFTEKEVRETVKQILEKNFAKYETADWKIYNNKKYGFEFQYPAIYDEKEEFQSCKPKESINTVDPYLFVSVANRVWVQILDSEGLDLSDYVDRKINQDIENKVIEIESEKIGLIYGNKSIEITYRLLGSNAWGEMAYILKDKNIYAFSLERPNSKCDSEINNVSIFSVYKKLLSTFKFTD